MNIDKTAIVDLLRQQGKDTEATKAGRDLPDRVDTDRDGGLLSKYGISVDDILERLPGGLGEKIDNLPGGLGKKLDDLL